jgi:predicted alpha-1,2-mannosidase
MQHGYVPASVGRSASTTTEYAHDDFALGNLALALGHPDDAGTLDGRRRGWRMLFDDSVGFLRARDPELGFVGDHFDPNDQLDDYAEANAWQSLWMAGAHDVEGLVDLLGGVDGFVDKLTTFFEETRLDWENADAAAANFPRPYYWHGNEPDLNAVYLFAQAGRADLTQQWVRWLVDTLYDDTPAGLAGNDDGGTLGSWYVLSTLGLYPIPGSDRYVIGAPRFPQARVVVGGHELVIAAPDVSDEHLYVRAVTLDGVPVEGWELTHAQLTAASELRFEMSDVP